MDTAPASSLPLWVFNSTIDETGWVHVPCEMAHPWELPRSLRHQCVTALRQTGPFQGLVAAGLLNGIHLTLLQLKTLHGLLKFQMPAKGQGQGKNGAIVRQDWLQKLVEHVFPTLSPEEVQRLVSLMMAGTAKHLRKDACNPHSKDILRCWHSLDKADTEEYKKLAEVAQDEIVLDLERDKRSREVMEQPSERQHVTPRSLLALLPQSGLEVPCRLSRHPALKRYQVFYTSKKGS